MNSYLLYAQIGVAVLLVLSILLQQRGTALGSSFGSEGAFFSTRRGIQQKLYFATIVLGILFIGLSLSNLLL